MPHSSSGALSGLSARAMATLKSRSPCPVDAYRLIASGIAAVDLCGEAAEPVRRRFNAYYGVRRNAVWRDRFYSRFQAAKASTLRGADLFADIVAGLQADTGRIEASFASKLVATLQPQYPIIDSVVRKWLAKHTTPPPFEGGIEGVVAYYRWLDAFMVDLAASREAEGWSAEFETAFPTRPGAVAIPAMKRLDFLIWGGAER